MDNVIVIVGPTASGKTKLAIELALKHDGEVVSADSMQIYKKLDIGTAKPTKEEMKAIPHHLIDFLDPLDEFNVVQYQGMARQCIAEIIARGKMPILAGGTGFYINSVIYNTNFAENEKNDAFREKLAREAELYGNEYLHNKLKEVDPVAANNIHMNNVKRVIRALEVYEFTNKKFSEHIQGNKIDATYNFIIIGLNLERDYLYNRINVRVEKMLEDGLLEETERLYESGYLEGKTSSAAIGHKELLPFIKGELPFDIALDSLKQATRNYAKRQMTWFRRIPEINWINIDSSTKEKELFQRAIDIIEQKKK